MNVYCTGQPLRSKSTLCSCATSGKHFSSRTSILTGIGSSGVDHKKQRHVPCLGFLLMLEVTDTEMQWPLNSTQSTL